MAREVTYEFRLPITTEEHLLLFVEKAFGVRLPEKRVCAGHVSVREAFCAAYFAANPIEIWHASRGLGGKTFTLALLTATEAATLKCDVNLLGGSGVQSKRALEAASKLWSFPRAPRALLKSEPTSTVTRLSWGNTITALMASQRSVRGPHVPRLRMDEIDELSLPILDAALGQTLASDEVAANTVLSSTWQYADGTMTEMLKRAADRGYPVRRWCIARGQRVLTQGGTVPIEALRAGQKVWTRSGWRKIQHATRMGVKDVVRVSCECGASLRCTPDHRLATSEGWTEAGSVAAAGFAFPVAIAWTNIDVATRHRMAAPTSLAAPLVLPRPTFVLARGHGLKMRQAYAGAIAAEMIDVQASGKGAEALLVDLAMSVGTSPFASMAAMNALDAVSIAPGSLPLDAWCHVHDSINTGIDGRAEVWDIGVEGEHEFGVQGFIAHNCYHETQEPHGWLTNAEIARKKYEVTQAMWDAEFELQEPSHEGRAIDEAKLAAMFDDELGSFEGKIGEYIEVEPPIVGADYTTGADWAKKQDNTVITTLRIDTNPYRVVAFERHKRMPWPHMVGRFDVRVKRYPGQAAHDATGVGDVVADYMSTDAEGVILGGRTRSDLFTEYIAAIEHDEIRAPRIRYMQDEHKYADNDALFGQGHPPDSIVAGAMAYRAIKLRVKPQSTTIIIGADELQKTSIVDVGGLR